MLVVNDSYPAIVWLEAIPANESWAPDEGVQQCEDFESHGFDQDITLSSIIFDVENL